MEKGRYRAVFASIYATYLAVCIIILGVAGVGYANNYKILKEQVLGLSGQQAEQVMSQLDGEFARVNAMLTILSSNTVLKEIMGDSDTELSVNSSGVRKLMVELSAITQMDPRLHVLVYFQNSDSLLDVSQRRYNAQMLEYFYQGYRLSEEEFYDVVNFSGNAANHAFEDGRVWLMKAVYDSGYRKKAVLMTEIDMNSFIDVKSGENIFLLAAGDVVIYANGMDKESAASYIGEIAETDGQYVKCGDCYFVSHEMELMGWQCYTGIAERSLSKGLRMFWYILLIELAGAVLLVIVLSLYSARRMYKPIGQMLLLLDAEHDVRFQDTYGSLAQKLEELLNDSRRNLKRAKNSQIFLDNYQIGRILNGEIKNESAAEGIERLTGISKQGRWVMALFRISDKNKTPAQTRASYEPGEELNLQFFVLQNIVNELILATFGAGGIYWQKEHYCLFVELGERSLKELQEKLEYMADFYENMLHMLLYIEIGQPREGFDGIGRQYGQLLDDLEYHIFWQGEETRNQVWTQQPAGQSWPSSSFGEYVEASRRLYNFLQAGEYLKAYETLDYIVSETFSRDPKYLRYNIYRMYGIAAMLTMSIEEQTTEENQAFFEELSFEERLGGVDNVEEFMRISKELFDRIIKHDSEKGKGAPAWLNEVIGFIQENYRDQNLSVSDVADKFWISVPHLSRTFKKYMDSSVLEYIQLLRVEEAKRLLAEGKNVAETSVRVGYLDAKALTRAFKRHEGITPGKYREMALQKK